jgi:hypothetical protein
MTPDELEKWANKQIGAAVARGINPLDAAAAVKRFLSKLPPGADPDHYIPNDSDRAASEAISKAAVDDSRADWYGKAEPRNARLLDAKGTE